MRKGLLLLMVVCLGVSLVTASAATATASTSSKKVPGQQIAQTIAMITGVAISPLMGVGAVGAWQYFQAKTPEQKQKLHWFSNPLFWLPALLLAAACFVKDAWGTVLPAPVKKPLDVAEIIEHKISALVMAGAFIPIVSSIFHSSGGGDASALGAANLAAIDLSWLYNIIMVPIALAAYVIVFIASNAINVLILLSPITVVDAALKAFRTVLIGSIAATSLANPWMGAAWAIVIIGICYLISGWSFRLTHFGLVYVWDFITGRRRRFKPDKTENKMFLGRKIDKVPARTYGRLRLDENGRLVLRYKPWLIFAERSLTLPEARYAVGKGLFFSEIMQLDGDKARIALLLPPRYLTHEQELLAIYNLTDVRAVGLRAAWQWIKGMLGFKTTTTAAA